MKFTDLAGEEWSLALTLGIVEAVEDAVGLNLSDRKGIESLFGDRKKLLQALGIILSQQLDSRGIDFARLKHQFDGDTIANAGEALLESLLIFSQGRAATKIGSALRKQIQQQRQEAIDRAVDAIESGRLLPNGDTSSAASQGSIPEGSLYGS